MSTPDARDREIQERRYWRAETRRRERAEERQVTANVPDGSVYIGTSGSSYRAPVRPQD